MRIYSTLILVILALSILQESHSKKTLHAHKFKLSDPQPCQNGMGSINSQGKNSCLVSLDLTKTLPSTAGNSFFHQVPAEVKTAKQVVQELMKIYRQGPVAKTGANSLDYWKGFVHLKRVGRKRGIVVSAQKSQIGQALREALRYSKDNFTPSEERISIWQAELESCKLGAYSEALLHPNVNYPRDTDTLLYKAGNWLASSCRGPRVEVLLFTEIIEIEFIRPEDKAIYDLYTRADKFFDAWLAWDFFASFSDQCPNSFKLFP